MRDFFDIHALSENRHFDGDILTRAVRATFERRRTPIPESLPLAMTPAFAAIRAKQTQWQGFLGKSGLSSVPTQLSDVRAAYLCPDFGNFSSRSFCVSPAGRRSSVSRCKYGRACFGFKMTQRHSFS
jgi:hypothetical protein